MLDDDETSSDDVHADDIEEDDIMMEHLDQVFKGALKGEDDTESIDSFIAFGERAIDIDAMNQAFAQAK